MRTFIIGEMASAHDGDLAKAYRLIEAAKEAGCDAVKAQYWSDADALANRRKVGPEYRMLYHRYQVPRAWLPRLKAKCDALQIEFMCTTFLAEDIGIVAPFVKRFKISGFEASDPVFIAAHAPFSKPVVVSRPGGSGPWADRTCRAVLLHCVAAYPAPFDELNLLSLRSLCLDGFSDHSGLIETGGIAVAVGATILEVHLKLPDTDTANPDAGEFAHQPESLAAYVAFVRQVEQMLGDGQKRVMPSEAAMLPYRVQA